MAFVFQQMSDYGTTNPIVARLEIQTADLLQFYDLTDEQKDGIKRIFMMNLGPRLMDCSRIGEKLTQEVLGHQKSMAEKGVPVQAHGNAYTIPSILDLNHRSETFLYCAKTVLRDLVELFNILYGTSFSKEAKYDPVLKWAKKKFGEKHPFPESLKADRATWIDRIVQFRNAVEHPDGHSGVLHIQNFTSTIQDGVVEVLEPVWYRNHDKAASIVEDMNGMVESLLTFCEELLIMSLQPFMLSFPIGIIEYPVEKRDPACPVRFKMVPIVHPSQLTQADREGK